ncbi:DUF5996 family protein [Brevibacterium casei]|uniref:Ava_C0101 and related proteins n=1 Tax=Brevibacterium casei TaxID=33889 RepID=A0A269ZFS8_9MICO|nr:DUF5996 family protein [Brevibacterium casei]PAK96668.1 hypothetical protein B8X04_05000 [Brevibacterium casei]
MASSPWPQLRVDDLTETRECLHQWLQIVGKIELVSTTLINHWWNVTFDVSARGLRTQILMHQSDRTFDAEFDFIDSVFVLRASTGETETVPLTSQSVADFYHAVMTALLKLGVGCTVSPRPNELPEATPFAEDTRPRTYDPESARLWWRQLQRIEKVFAYWRAGFAGKASPVQLFWGSMDLSATRYSGRTAPPSHAAPPNCPPWVMAEAEDRENVAVGFWAGGSDEGSFYAYAYPAPEGYYDGTLTAGGYDSTLGEYLLPYADVRTAADPEATLLTFLDEVYARAADLADWDRKLLEVDQDRLIRYLPPADLSAHDHGANPA